MAAKISRVTLEVPRVEEVSTDPFQRDLAMRASKVLGYGFLEDELKNVESSHNKQVVLKDVVLGLQELEVSPLNTDEVKNYQKKEVNRLNRGSFFSLPIYAQIWVLLNEAFSPIDRLPKKFLAFFLVSSGLGLIIEVVDLFCGVSKVSWYASPFALSGLALIYLLALSNRFEKLTIQEWKWERLTLQECHRRKIAIPEFALQTAISVKEKLPKTEFFVEIAVSTDRQLGDPFLVAKYDDGMEHYLEVWEESKFERMTTRKA